MIHVYTTGRSKQAFQIIDKGIRVEGVDIRYTPEAVAGIRCIAVESVPVVGVLDRQDTAAEQEHCRIGTVPTFVEAEKQCTREVTLLRVAARTAAKVGYMDTAMTIVRLGVVLGTQTESVVMDGMRLAGRGMVLDTLVAEQAGWGRVATELDG
jgi:hypothetical protein